ncbi:hypothetical protein CKO25_18685 [Thiocapsa imhoffii]|uniref:LysE family translocator n=1 Tax=Thiocapsa imhoffii TaxID=382777 RepID=A0A9X0WMH8_9GAMM|nr:LysE family translocator [Thiocapsa imhoffii]MBK1646627.1 hypothetical protein [Thiocapsa imhoffii]
MSEILFTGLILGISAGLAPGPLLALVIAETLQHDVRAGIKVAIAPLITDLPLILVTLFISTRLAAATTLLGVISLCGAFFLLVMASKTLRSSPDRLRQTVPAGRPASLTKGILANVLSPYPYLFWLSVGGPLMTRALVQNPLAPVLFILVFYAVMVGSKIALAMLVGHSKAWLRERWLTWFDRVIGMLLLVLSFRLFQDALILLELVGQDR